VPRPATAPPQEKRFPLLLPLKFVYLSMIDSITRNAIGQRYNFY
jgi:hypothetical protein